MLTFEKPDLKLHYDKSLSTSLDYYEYCALKHCSSENVLRDISDE